MLHAIIMAGGSGTRFWPASRHEHPKQFLSIGCETSLIRQTALRVHEKFSWENILVVTAKAHAKLASAELPELPESNLWSNLRVEIQPRVLLGPLRFFTREIPKPS